MTDRKAAAASSAGVKEAVVAWEALLRAQVGLMRRFVADDIWSPVSMREYDVLFTLASAEQDGMRLHQLNEEILLTQPSLSRLVDRLVARGLLTKGAAPNDRRGSWIRLTEEGAEVQKTIGRAHAARISHYVGQALEPAELQELNRLTTKLRLAQPEITDYDQRTPRVAP